MKIDNVGVHSISKGEAKYFYMGTTSAPHIAVVCNRSVCTMGEVKDTYVQYEEAIYQHFGQVVAGLNVLSKNYA